MLRRHVDLVADDARLDRHLDARRVSGVSAAARRRVVLRKVTWESRGRERSEILMVISQWGNMSVRPSFSLGVEWCKAKFSL